MKRAIALSLTTLLLLGGVLLFSCTGGISPAANPLAHQQYPLVVVADLTYGNTEYTITLTLTAPMTATIEFLEPATLVGYVFTITPEGVTLSFGEVTVQYNNNSMPGGSLLLPQMFSLDMSQLLRQEESVVNSVPLNVAVFATPHGEITLFINQNTSLPLRVEAVHEGTPVVLRIRTITSGDVAE